MCQLPCLSASRSVNLVNIDTVPYVLNLKWPALCACRNVCPELFLPHRRLATPLRRGGGDALRARGQPPDTLRRPILVPRAGARRGAHRLRGC